jgi:hypothetical protein
MIKRFNCTFVLFQRNGYQHTFARTGNWKLCILNQSWFNKAIRIVNGQWLTVNNSPLTIHHWIEVEAWLNQKELLSWRFH